MNETVRCECGRSMVLRTARRGTWAGNQFWGCKGYPICTKTKSRRRVEIERAEARSPMVRDAAMALTTLGVALAPVAEYLHVQKAHVARLYWRKACGVLAQAFAMIPFDVEVDGTFRRFAMLECD